MKPILAVHGGAWNIPDELWEDHQRGCARAHEAGLRILNAGGPALEAICEAIRILEDDPTFDAGYGSFLNEKGQVELDAGLMEGKELQCGAVVGVSKVKNPIDLAHHVLKNSPHCLFSGEGAHQVAWNAGFTQVSPNIHIHEREALLHERIKNGEQHILQTAWTAQPCDTVGAIALDSMGNLAAGNSTGGILDKAEGRIGDAPLLGLGYYADNDMGAFVCTGWGESIMRSAMGMKALTALSTITCQEAADLAINHLKRRVSGFGGMILMRPNGETAVSFNTQRMAFKF